MLCVHIIVLCARYTIVRHFRGRQIRSHVATAATVATRIEKVAGSFVATPSVAVSAVPLAVTADNHTIIGRDGQ